MINYDSVSKENINKKNLNWPWMPDYPYQILIIGSSGYWQTNTLLNLMKQQDDDHYSIIVNVYLYVKDPYEAKYQYLIKKHETGLKNLKDPKAFIEYSNNMQDVYENIEEYNPDRKYNVLIIFDDMIADMSINNKLNQIVTELFIRGRKLNVSALFIRQSYVQVPKDVRLNCKRFFYYENSKQTRMSSNCI